MARLTDKEREEILIEWKIGRSQNYLAKKYDCSPATINKLCKGIEQDSLEIVNSQMAINRALSHKSEQEVNTIHQEVNRQMQRENLVFGNAEKLANKLMMMADQIDSPVDLKTLAEANDKLAITLKVADRHAPKMDVTQQMAIQGSGTPVIQILEDKGV